mmetsp:Transcript_13087/g.29759  ORF Transcript_13087/g.29759 Transcript_13087/m.29759 type:complete len:201 (-) Transcript_13087:1224-1826(-)
MAGTPGSCAAAEVVKHSDGLAICSRCKPPSADGWKSCSDVSESSEPKPSAAKLLHLRTNPPCLVTPATGRRAQAEAKELPSAEGRGMPTQTPFMFGKPALLAAILSALAAANSLPLMDTLFTVKPPSELAPASVTCKEGPKGLEFAKSSADEIPTDSANPKTPLLFAMPSRKRGDKPDWTAEISAKSTLQGKDAGARGCL